MNISDSRTDYLDPKGDTYKIFQAIVQYVKPSPPCSSSFGALGSSPYLTSTGVCAMMQYVRPLSPPCSCSIGGLVSALTDGLVMAIWVNESMTIVSENRSKSKSRCFLQDGRRVSQCSKVSLLVDVRPGIYTDIL